MKHSPTRSRLSVCLKAALFSATFACCCTGVMAQSKTSKTTSKPAATAIASNAAATTGTTPTTKTTTSTSALDKVLKSPTKIITLHDRTAFKATAKYARRKAKYDHNEDGSGMHKQITYKSDGSKLNLTMVKNPSFGGQATSITAKTKPKSKENKKINGSDWVCATNSVKLSATSTSFLNNDYSASAAHIYPGAIYTFDNFYSGNYKEQTGARNPISVVIDNPDVNGSTYITVSNPSMTTMIQGVHSLTKELPSRDAAAESFTYQVYETGNAAQQSLQVSGGASGYGIAASASYGTSSSSNTINITIDATKIMYTITTAPPDSDYFVSQSDETVPNQMIVGSVSYGIRVLANLTYTFSSSSEAADFKASYSGWGVNANIGLDQVSKSSNVSSTINCYVVGGPGNGTLSFDKKDLQKQLKQIFAGATYQNAMPIAYEFYDMAGDVIGSNSTTDDFDVQACVPNTTGGHLRSAYFTFTTAPGSGKRGNDNYNIYLYSNDPISNQSGKVNQYNGAGGGVKVDPSIGSYQTQGQNVDYVGGQSNTVEATLNPRFGDYYGNDPKYRPDLNMDWFVKNGGIVNLHIFPDGSDTWNIQSLVLTLNFDGGITKTVTWKNISVADYSTQATLYFDGTFSPR